MNENDSHEVENDEDLVKLIRIAGVRSPIDQERTTRVREVVELEWKEAVAEYKGPANRVLLAAAAAAVLIVVAIIAVRSSTQSLPVGTVEIALGTVTLESSEGPAGAGTLVTTRREIATTPDSRAAIRLQSGVSVRLDHGTRITFATPRTVHLISGALYVDSPATSTDHDLVVITPNAIVKEIGTQFETRLSGSDVVVRVREGRVEVSAGESVVAGPGSRVTVSSTGSLSSETVSNWGENWSWVLEAAPAFEIEGRTVGEFLEWVSRETGLQVNTEAIEEGLIESTRLHGSIEGMTPTEAIEAVLPASGLEVETEEGRLTVTRSGQAP